MIAVAGGGGVDPADRAGPDRASKHESPGHVGVLFFPELGGAVFTAFLFGALVRTRFVPALAWTGLLSLAGGAAVLTGVATGPNSLVLVGSGLIGIGLGSSVAPALFTTGFSLRAGQLQRVFAMLELLRGAAAFAAGPIIVHLADTTGGSPAAGIRIGVWVCFAIVVTGARPRCTCSSSAAASSRFPTSRTGRTPASRPGTRRRWPPGSAAPSRTTATATAPRSVLARCGPGRGDRPRPAGGARRGLTRRIPGSPYPGGRMDVSIEPVAAYLASLETDVREVAPGEWGLVLDAAGYVLNLGLTIRGPLLRAQAAVLPPGLIDPHQLLYWNRQAPFVCFAENQAGEVIVCGELPLQSLDAEMLDRFLGLLLASATRAREFAIKAA